MKKILLASAALLATIAFTSCDTKLCYCYERGYDGTVYQSEVYVDYDVPCSSQSTDYRGCIESRERNTMDPNDIAK